MDPSTSTDIPESALALALGLDRHVLKKLRAQMATPAHWHGGEGAAIMITPAGRALLTQLLASADPGTEKNPAPRVEDAAQAALAPDRYVALVVVRVATSRALFAKKPAPLSGDARAPDPAPAPLRVLVKNSAHFLPGMPLERCEPSAEIPGLYYYHGRLPRRRGRF